VNPALFTAMPAKNKLPDSKLKNDNNN